MKKLQMLIATLASISLFTTPSHATSESWTGLTNGTWANPANWNSGAGPAPGALGTTANSDTATFNTAGVTVTVDSGRNLQNITFDTANAGAFILTGGSLVLTGGGTIQTTSTVGAVAENINSAITLEGNYTFAQNSNTTASLKFGGAISSASGSSTTLNLSTAGSTSVANTLSGVISDGTAGSTLALSTTGAGTWILSGNNTFSGGVSVGGGKLQVGASNGTSGTLGSGNVSVASGAGLVFARVDPLGYTVANNISGAGSLTKSGTNGVLILTGSNSYTGGTSISNGILNIQNNTALGGTGANTVSSGATLQLQNNITVGNQALNLSGSGATISGGTNATGALENVSGTNTYGGLIKLVAASTISSDAGTLNLTNTGTLFGNATATALTLTGAGNGSITSIINGGVSNAVGAGTLTKSGSGNWTLAGNNTYTGATSINGGNLVITGALASGSAVTVGNNTSTASILSGTGTVNGSVTTASTGTNVAYIAPGVNSNSAGTFGSAGTLHIGSAGLNLGAGTTLDIDLGTATTIGGSTNDLISMGGGTLTIGGTLNISINALGTLTTGSSSANFYTLITGAASNSGLGTGTYTATVAGTSDTAHVFVSGNNLDVFFTSSVTGTTYSLGVTAASNLLHVGATTTVTSTITNTGGAGADGLNYSGLGASSSLSNNTGTASGSGGPLANNGSASNTSTYTATTAGTDTVTSTVSSATNASGGNATLSGTAGTTTINVYTGLSTWNINGGGSWSTAGSGAFAAGANWGANQGAPGVTAGFANTDTATFDNTALTGGNSATVTLDGATPSLKSITFNTQANSGYTIAQGTGGSLALDGSGGNATVTVISGTHTISAPVSLTTSADVNVASGQQINFSGAVSGSGGLNNIGGGTTILSSATGNTYRGPTTISGGKVYITNASGSGTGTGAIGVSGTGVLAFNHTGAVSGAITLSSGGSFYSGGVANGMPTTGPGTGAGLSAELNVNGGNLTFALNAGGAATQSAPNMTTSFITTSSTINFTGTDTITLVDLSNGGLSLRMNQPYLLATSSLGNAGFTGLVTSDGDGHLTLDGNGYVVGVWAGGSNPLTDNTAITFNELGADGVTPLSVAGGSGQNLDQSYLTPQLVLFNGNLEVVPEPGTWALMIGGLALLVVIQRRKGRLS